MFLAPLLSKSCEAQFLDLVLELAVVVEALNWFQFERFIKTFTNLNMIFSEEWIKHRNLSLKLNFSLMTPRDIEVFLPCCQGASAVEASPLSRLFVMKIMILKGWILKPVPAGNLENWPKCVSETGVGRISCSRKISISIRKEGKTRYSVKDVTGFNTLFLLLNRTQIESFL